MENLFLIVLLVALIMLGAPIGFIMVVVPTVYILLTDALPLVTVPYQMYEAISHGPLVAIPFFILTAEIMNSGRITERLLDLSRELVGRVRGGLAQASVLISMLFASMNGSAVADTAAVGAVMIPAMKKSGYSGPFSAALIATAGTIGGIIPPSIAMIILSSNLNLSIGAMFASGILPGILIGLMLMGVCFVYATLRNYERYDVPFSWRVLWRVLGRALLPLLIPIILVGGILGGVFSTVEAGAITATSALLIAGLLLRSLSWPGFTRAVGQAVRTTASIFIIIAAAGPFGWMLSRLGALNFLQDWLLGFKDQPVLFVVAMLFVIVLAGMVMDVVANLIILGPLLVKVMVLAGYHQYQAALIVCVGFLLGTVTPPVGVSLFTVAAIAREKLGRVSVAVLPFCAVEVVALLLLITVPELSLALPRALGYMR